MPRTLEQRFWGKVYKRDEVSECWLWLAAVSGGYGRFNLDAKRQLQAHTVAWILTNGPIREGVRVFHGCGNRLCVRPAHLFLGTNLDNMRDRDAKGRAASHKGTLNGAAKLTETDVLEIRRLYASGEYDYRALTQMYGVSKSTISSIIRKESWSHV